MRVSPFLRVFAGYVAAIIAAPLLIYGSYALLVMISELVSFGSAKNYRFIGSALYIGGAGAVVLGIIALPGWVVLVILAERRHVQTKRWFMLGGSISAALPFAVIQTFGILLRSETARADDYRSNAMVISDMALTWLVALAAGLVAGWVYWLISGRHSGSTKDVPAVTPSTPAGSSQ
jgi:hypothetical protein